MTLRDYKGALHCFTEQIKILKTYATKDSGDGSSINQQHLAIPYHNLAYAYRKLNHRVVSLRFAKASYYIMRKGVKLDPPMHVMRGPLFPVISSDHITPHA
eukprot:sb/3478460/